MTLVLSGVTLAVIIALAAWQLGVGEQGGDNEGTDQVVVEDGVEREEEEQEEPAEVDSDSDYIDGEYVASGNYISPAGEEEVIVTLTLEDDVIVDAEFDGQAVHPTSRKMQGQFSEGFEAEVEGKSLDEIALTVVNGSSLTPKGFMDAVAKIKAEAEAEV